MAREIDREVPRELMHDEVYHQRCCWPLRSCSLDILAAQDVDAYTYYNCVSVYVPHKALACKVGCADSSA